MSDQPSAKSEKGPSDPSETSPSRKVTSRAPRPGGGLLGYLVVLVVTACIVWFVFATVTGVPPGLAKTEAQAAPTGGGTDYVYLMIAPGCSWCNAPFNASDEYTPANFTVPSHTLIVLTITNYDNGQNAVPSNTAQVSGVLGNVEYQNATPPANWGTAASSVALGDVSHTFTAMATSTSPGFNIPIPASDGPTGSSVTVKLFFNSTGTISWQCLAPCDSWSMADPGFMQGTITVV